MEIDLDDLDKPAGGWLPLLVRIEDYEHFSGEVARRERDRLLTDPAPSPEPGAMPETAAAAPRGLKPPADYDPERLLAPWPLDELRRLADSDYTTTRRWTQAIDVVAAHEGRYLSTAQVAELAGMPIGEWRDAPRKITRHLQRHYDVPGWPLYAVSGRDLGRDDQVYWAISREQAKRWRQVRPDPEASTEATDGAA